MALQFEKNASLLDRLPIEGASENELALVEELRAAILKKRGLSEAPRTGWHAQHFTRARLVHYLRAKNGKVDSALDYLSTAIDALDGIRQKALEYESSSPLARDLADRYTPLGFYGIDYRGASVCVSRQRRTQMRLTCVSLTHDLAVLTCRSRLCSFTRWASTTLLA